MSKNKLTAVLGPTNTGKTFLAIETMLSFDNGMIGFPLRLLAREVYDKIIQKVDASKVALITGEEKIIPLNAKYFLCTVESMPVDKVLDFVGIDEIQMCSDHERGHIFTDRLLNLRGEKLTMLMGSNTIKNIISKLDDDVIIQKDSKRSFNFKIRPQLWFNQRKKCAISGKVIPLESIMDGNITHVDHIVPHAKGGETIIENAQLVFADENLNKSDDVPVGSL